MNDSAYVSCAAPRPKTPATSTPWPSPRPRTSTSPSSTPSSGSSHNATNATDFLSVLLDPAVQTEFSARKGSIPVRLDADVSGLDEYQQHSVADFRKLPILQSIAYGELVSPPSNRDSSMP